LAKNPSLRRLRKGAIRALQEAVEANDAENEAEMDQRLPVESDNTV
jgi:hypothetical protein